MRVAAFKKEEFYVCGVCVCWCRRAELETRRVREEEERKRRVEEEKRRVEQIEADRRLAENLLKQEEEEWKQRYSYVQHGVPL